MKQLKQLNIFSDEDDEFDTCSVSDLIKFLQQFPNDMNVLASWEGQYVAFGNAKIIKKTKQGATLLINVDSGQCDCFEEPLEF